jgi:hypothetical protein
MERRAAFLVAALVGVTFGPEGVYRTECEHGGVGR